MNQWMGIVINERRLALSVPCIAAVFRCTSVPRAKNSKVIDVVVHAGAPVFIAKLSSVFEAVREIEDRSDETHGEWVVVMAFPVDPQLGFRADHVKGPFHAIARDGQVSYDGNLWQVLDGKRVVHA